MIKEILKRRFLVLILKIHCDAYELLQVFQTRHILRLFILLKLRNIARFIYDLLDKPRKRNIVRLRNHIE